MGRDVVRTWAQVVGMLKELEKYNGDEPSAQTVIQEIERTKLDTVRPSDRGVFGNMLTDGEALLKDARERLERSLDPPSADFGPSNVEGRVWNLTDAERRRLVWREKCLALRCAFLQRHIDAYDEAERLDKERSRERRARSLERFRRQRAAQIAVQAAKRREDEKQYLEALGTVGE